MRARSNKNKQEAHGPRYAHLSEPVIDYADADGFQHGQ